MRRAVSGVDLSLIPRNIDNVSAAEIPAAHLTAHMALGLGRFQAGKTSSGAGYRRLTQLARALGGESISETSRWWLAWLITTTTGRVLPQTAAAKPNVLNHLHSGDAIALAIGRLPRIQEASFARVKVPEI